MRLFPFQDLSDYQARDLRADATAAFSVLFMSVPQGVAYAMIAGLPPVMGLYAAAVPTIVGALLRSSRHVVTGPTNALSLLYGAGIAQQLQTDPATTAITAAMLVGILQIAAGVFRAGALLTYISRPLLLGYITGAGLLIALGQLTNITGTESTSGNVIGSFISWIETLSSTSWLAVSVSLSTIALILLLQKLQPRLPGPAIAMTLATITCIGFELQDAGLVVVRDLSPIPMGFPSLTLPNLSLVIDLLPISLALTTLSLIESNSIAQTIGLESKQSIDNNVEFLGQGFANLSAAFCGGYPISGSLSRSKLNHSAGAQTRLAGAFSGILMLMVLLGLSDFINDTPLSALAGLLMIVAWNLIDTLRIRSVLAASNADKMTFLFTFFAMLTLSLDVALYASIGLVLIIARLGYEQSTIHEYILVDHELTSGVFPMNPGVQASNLRVIEIQGKVFFGMAQKIQNALNTVAQDSLTRCVVIHLHTTHTIDFTTANIILESSQELEKKNIQIVISGLCNSSKRELDNAQKIYPTPKLHYLAENGIWSLEKHRKVLEIQK